MKTLVPMMLLLLVSSCGKSGGDSGTQVSNNIEKEEVVMKEGKYVAFLRPINSTVNGFIPFGRAELALQEDVLNITTYLDDDQRVMHVQNIFTASKCPTTADDTNKDGVIDIKEAHEALGSILLPLDNDITTRKSGEGQYPQGPSFTYNKKGNWSEILKDLQVPYGDDHYLLKGDYLSLENRVILVQGTSASGHLPSTVATVENLEPHVSVPISCGVIKPI